MEKFIVVLEDNGTILDLLKEFLPSIFSGYEIIFFSDIHSASEFIFLKIREIKLCIFDGKVPEDQVELGCITFGSPPKGRSWTLASEMRKRGYEKKIIYIGGDMPNEDFCYLYSSFCLKTFTLETLQEHIISSMN